MIVVVLRRKKMLESSPYEPPGSGTMEHKRSLSKLRYVPAVFMLGLGVLLTIWGIVSFVLSVSPAIHIGTVGGWLRWCGGPVVFAMVGLAFLMAGILFVRGRYMAGTFSTLLAIMVFLVGAFLLLPYI